MKRQERFRPITFFKHEVMRVFPGSTAKTQRSTFLDFEVGSFICPGDISDCGIEIAEIENVATLLDCFSIFLIFRKVLAIGFTEKVTNCRQVRRKNYTIANVDEV